MKQLLKNILLTILLFSTSIYAGGKDRSAVKSGVISVPETEDISAWYLGLGLVATKFYSCGDNCDYEDVTYGAMLRGGYDFNEYFGLEGRGLRTFLGEGPFGGVPLQHIGIYAKPQYPISEQVNIYGLLGYGYTSNLGNGARLDYFDNDDGLSAGLGLEYDLSDREEDFEENGNYDREFDGYADQGRGWSLFADYQRLLIKSDVPDLDSVSFGVRYDF